MSRRDEHREVSVGRASEAGSQRFRGELRRQVGDLEVRLEEAQLRSNAFLGAGLTREAEQVLEESRRMVGDFQQRMSAALASAAVEREAERIFAGSLDVLDVLGTEGADAGGGFLARIPAGVGAAVASFAVLALAVVTMRAPQERELRPAADVALAASDTDARSLPAASSGANRTWSTSFSTAELEVLAVAQEPEAVAPLLERRRQLLDRLAIGGQPAAATVLAELNLLVERLVREGVDVERLLQLERAAEEEARESDTQGPPPAPQEPAPAPEEPQQEPEEPQASDPESDPEEHEPVFPFNGQEDGEDGDEPSDGSGGGAGASGDDNEDKGGGDPILGD